MVTVTWDVVSSWTKWISYYLKITNDTICALAIASHRNGANFTNYSCHSFNSRSSCLILFNYLLLNYVLNFKNTTCDTVIPIVKMLRCLVLPLTNR